MHPPQRAVDGDVLKGTFEMVRRSENHRLMNVAFVFSHGERPGPTLRPARPAGQRSLSANAATSISVWFSAWFSSSLKA